MADDNKEFSCENSKPHCEVKPWIISSGRSIMYSSAWPRTKLWGNPALVGYSCEELPSRTTWSCLLLKNEEIKANIWPEIP